MRRRVPPDIGKAGPLTPAQQQLVLQAMGLTEALVSTLAPRVSEDDRNDLIQAGDIGAMEAALGFDPGVGVRFTTYAYSFIAGAILDVLKKDRKYRKWMREASLEARRFAAETPDRFNILWDPDEANESRLRIYAVRLVAAMIAMVAQSAGTPEEDVAEVESCRIAVQVVRAAYEGMSEDERRLYTLRYVQGKKLKDIAAEMGVAEITTRRHHQALLDRIAAVLHEREVTTLPSLWRAERGPGRDGRE